MLVALDGFLGVSQGVVTVAEVPEGAALVDDGGGGGELLEGGQLLLQVPDGVLEVAHVEASDTQIAESLSLERRVLNNGKAGVREGRRGKECGDGGERKGGGRKGEGLRNERRCGVSTEKAVMLMEERKVENNGERRGGGWTGRR